MNTAISCSGLMPNIDLMMPDERMSAIAGILAKGVLRLIEKQVQETREDRVFGEGLAAEIADLPGGGA